MREEEEKPISERTTGVLVRSEPSLVAGMMVTDDVRLVRQIGAGGMGSVWLADHLSLRTRVAVKFLHADGPLAKPDRLAREARIAAKIEHPHAVRVIAHSDAVGDVPPFLVMEFIAGESLARRIVQRGELDLASVQRLVRQVADVLGAAHEAGIIHRDIKPANIMLVAGTDELFAKVVDFGIAKSLESRDSSVLTMPGALVGTPAYMPPEQLIDGRPADAQSDLWGLAVVAYEALTGRPAFSGRARAAICAAMLLKRFERVTTLVPALPASLDEWFERALDVHSAARFASAEDLAKSFDEAARGIYRGEGSIARRGGLRIPDKLFGREQETAAVLRSFQGAAAGRSRLLLVSGYSGIGKSALVHEVEPTLTAAGATFVWGKFDQFDRGTPYKSLIEAFGQLPTPREESRGTVEERARPDADHRGRGAPAWAEWIDARVDGRETPSPELRNRVQAAVGRFVASNASAQHPLVMFLDDLQWADLASLDLVASLASDPDSHHVLIIGAYRANEVDASHPLTAALERLHAEEAAIDEISLGPLGEDAVHDLVSATFPGAAGRVRLAVECHAKTHGNAFFVRRWLESLYEEGLVRFDTATRQWSWDLKSIEARPVTENVVDFVAAEIDRMPRNAREAIRVAAVIGDAFDLDTLAAALHVERTAALDLLRAALTSGLVVPANENARGGDAANRLAFRFAHDRVRQAARSFVGDDTEIGIHREVGRYLLEHLDSAERDRRLFEIVDHLDRGSSNDTSRTDAVQLRALNLSAARRAMNSAAFEPAFRYFEQALRHVIATSWESDYEQTLSLHVEGARAAYLSGDHARAETLVAEAVGHARTALDRANAREVRIHALVSQQRFLDAVNLAIAALSELGLSLRADSDATDVERAIVGTLERVRTLTAEDVAALPMAHDARAIAIQRIQNDVMSSAYMAAPQLLPIMGCNIVRASLDSGICKESPYGFAIFGLVLNAIEAIDQSHRVGKLALEMLRRVEDRSVHPKTLHVVGTHVAPFVDPLRDSLDAERRVFRLGMDTGDLEYAAWAQHIIVCNGFYAGVPLDRVAQDFRAARSILLHHKQLAALGCTLQYGQAIENLLGRAENPARLVGSDHDERVEMERFRAINFRGAAYVLTVMGTFVRFLFGDLEGAREYADAGGEFADGAVATYHRVWWHQYRALAILGAVDGADAGRGIDAVKAVERDVKALAMWNSFSRVNHEHRVHLVDAEIARVSRRDDAAELYERAIEAAQRNGFVHEAAIAHELAARFHARAGREENARIHVRAAIDGFAKWGATAKVALLSPGSEVAGYS